MERREIEMRKLQFKSQKRVKRKVCGMVDQEVKESNASSNSKTITNNCGTNLK